MYGIMDAQRLYGNDDWIFQHEKAPNDTSKLVKDYLEMYKIRILDWPANSPDLNTIENLSGRLDTITKNRHCNTEEQLFQSLLEGWRRLDLDYIHNLILSMPRRCLAVIDNHGQSSDY